MQDVRDAVRALRATPIVTAMAVLSLALGIGANTAIFSILNTLLLRSLPVREPQALALVTLNGGPTSWTNPLWEQIRGHGDIFDGAFAWSSTRFNLSQGGPTQLVEGLWTSGRYFEVLGVPAILGRTLTEADDRRGGGPDGPVAVIGHNFWQRQFGGSPDAIGKPVTVERVTYTVVGVTPPDFFGTEVGRTFDIAIPLGTEPLVRGKESALDRRSSWWLSIMARRRPGQSLETASAALRGIQPQVRDATMPEQYRPQDRPRYLQEAFTAVPAAGGSSSMRRRYQQPLLTVMVVVALVLLIACANIANLLLARANARRHEISVRLALGASRFRLFRQLLAESLLLAVTGAALGLLFALWGSRLLVRQLSTSANLVFLDLSLDWRVLAFTAAVAITTAVLFGTVPALRATRVEPNEALKEKGRGQAGDGRGALGNALVVAQVALSLMLIVGAGLFMRTFSSLASLDLGFQRERVLVANVNAQRLQLDQKARAAFFEQLRGATAAVPGVERASLSAVTPVSGSSWQFGIAKVDGVPVPGGDEAHTVFVNLVGPEWFATYGTRLLAGRDFSPADGPGSPRVVIVNESFVRKFMGGRSPVGHHLTEDGPPSVGLVEDEIVGYVKDAVYRSLRDDVPPTMYVCISQYPNVPSSMAISLRAAGGSPAALIKPVADAITTANRDVAITFRPLAEQVNNSLVQERILAMLSGFFGGLALLLAGLGLYGVTSYAVSRRRTEIGIRMALGAQPGGVVRLVLARVALLVAAGVVVGGIATLVTARFVSTLLYGLQPRDPLTIGTAILVLGTIGALAGWLPAWRASRIDPARVLRDG